MDWATLTPQTKDLGGGFTVKRLLPAAQRRAVGPFIFFDHFGPITARSTDNHDVRSHPHIGLATVTYLFEGAMMHRDSTGVVQRIEPGAINWMTAGCGIVHSERTPDDLRHVDRRSHGLQLWVAVPAENEEDAPSFSHTRADDIPAVKVAEGASVRVLVGRAFGVESPVPTLSPTLYLDLQFNAGAAARIPAAAEERAIYAIDNAFALDGQPIAAHTMVLLPEGSEPELRAPEGARLVLIGGQPLGHRFVWWNLVSTRRERIVQAAEDWSAQRFAKVPGDDSEFIPLPQRPLP